MSPIAPTTSYVSRSTPSGGGRRSRLSTSTVMARATTPAVKAVTRPPPPLPRALRRGRASARGSVVTPLPAARASHPAPGRSGESSRSPPLGLGTRIEELIGQLLVGPRRAAVEHLVRD